jgi:hypothetical protein
MKKIIISLLAAVVLAFAPAAVAQSLQTYFNFTTYGTQGGGAALADLTGNTTVTLNTEAHTTLTSSGLTISAVTHGQRHRDAATMPGWRVG